MISDLLNKNTVQVIDGRGVNWKQAIQYTAYPLVINGTIENKYVDSMIKVVETNGPYINIGPKIALAHSRPAGNVHKIGLSVMKTHTKINLLNSEHPINLWFVLTATDNSSHLTIIQELVTILSNKLTVQKMLCATDKNELLKIILHQ